MTLPYYPLFTEAIKALGNSRAERAQVLAVDEKTVDRLMRRLPRPMRAFENAPHLLRALADDMENQRSTI
jgi:hypothetical protein